MRIGLEDIDPQIAQAVAERLCAPVPEFLKENIAWGGFLSQWKFDPKNLSVKRKRDPSGDEKRAYEIRKERETQFGLRVAGTILLPMAAGAGIFAGTFGTIHEAVMALTASMATWAAGTGAGVWWTRRALPKSRLAQAIQQPEMRAVFPLLTLTRAERIYCDTLLLLARMEIKPEVEVSVRETLRQLNSLLDSSRQLESRRLSLVPVLGTNPIAELEEEFGALGRRLDQTTDGAARQSLQQSLQMCAARLDNARAFEQGLERLKAQEEAIVQTISSAQTALARMQLVPEPQTEIAAQEIAESVAQMHQQTYAVEQAVQEVMQLRLP
jgi:hypothetical protein